MALIPDAAAHHFGHGMDALTARSKPTSRATRRRPTPGADHPPDHAEPADRGEERRQRRGRQNAALAPQGRRRLTTAAGYVHAIAHNSGAYYHVPHGLAKQRRSCRACWTSAELHRAPGEAGSQVA
jgi:hypothetical protein